MAFHRKKWLEEGFVFQNPKGDYILGQGPFVFRSNPSFPCLYRPDFFLTDSKPWVQSKHVCLFRKKEFANLLFQEKTITAFEKENFKPPSFITYQQLFYQSRQAIQKDLFQKIVPVFAESFKLKGSVIDYLKTIFKNTRHIPHGFLYGFWQKEKGFLGFTPEILFRLEGFAFSTFALAGTGLQTGPSLLKDSKETKEHDFVVQSLEESLYGFFKGEKGQTRELVFSPLKHLYTTFKGRLIKNIDFQELCYSLHPTAALGSYPKKEAFVWLNGQISQRQRFIFGAPFAYLESPKKAFCLVALRSLEWNQSKARIFSGSGILKESFLQKEWRELFLKRQQVSSFFSLK